MADIEIEDKAEKFDIALEKLSGAENWTIWKWQVRNYLEAKQLDYYIDNNDIKSVQRARQAKAIISGLLDRKNTLKVLHCQSAYEIWKHLESVYENKTSFELQNLLGQFYNFKITSLSTIHESISQIQGLAARIRNLGVAIDDKIIMSVILNSLPKEKFANFLTSWSMFSKSDDTLDSMLSYLMAEIGKLKASDSEVAFFVNGKNHKKRTHGAIHQDSNKQDGKAATSNNNKRKWSGDKKRVRGSCNYCKKSGHWVKDCMKLKRKKEAESNNNSWLKPSDRGWPDDTTFMAVKDDNIEKTSWVIDSGCSFHMTSNQDWLEDYQPLEPKLDIKTSNGETIQAHGLGKIKTTIGEMSQVHFVPEIAANLFSVAAASKHGLRGTWNKDLFTFSHKGKDLIKARRHGNLYLTSFEVKPQPGKAFAAATLNEWHNRFGHISTETIQGMIENKAVDGLNIMAIYQPQCEDCAYGKCHRTNHRTRTSPKVTKPGISLHLDTVGPIPTHGLMNECYFVICKDECSSYKIVKPVKSKTEIPNEVKLMLSQAEVETGNKPLQIVTDNGSEFVNANLSTYLRNYGINQLCSAPYTPQQNGFIEREVRTVVESARTILRRSKLPTSLWAEAVKTSTYVLNRLCARGESKTPYELWFSRKPNVSNLHTFGQEAVILNNARHLTKFESRGRKVHFVGYTNNHNTFRFFDPESEKIIVSCDAKFLNQLNDSVITVVDNGVNEQTWLSNYFHPSGEPKDLSPNYDTLYSSDESAPTPPTRQGSQQRSEQSETPLTPTAPTYKSMSEPITPTMPTFRSAQSSDTFTFENPRNVSEVTVTDASHPVIMSTPIAGTTTPPPVPILTAEARELQRLRIRDPNYHNLPRDKLRPNPKKTYHANLTVADDSDDPQSFEEAMNCKDKKMWVKAMEEELESLIKNDVWTLVERPNKNVVTSKWVLKIKRKPDGTIDRYKARLVARGFSQIYGIDYHETYAPVASMTSIRMLLAYAAVEHLKIAQFDIKTAFLYGDLDEQIYMEQPPGFARDKSKVWLLKKSLYGLKQAPRQWNIQFTSFLKELNLTVSENDGCIFYCTKPLLIITIYVDDGLIFAHNQETIEDAIAKLKTRFDIHRVESSTYLGFQIDISNQGNIFIHQEGYIKKILNKFNMNEAKPVDSPTTVSGSSSSSNETETEPLDSSVPYREAVGSLMYAAVIARPDIMYAVSRVSRKVSNPTEADWRAVKRIMRYLKGKENYGITYSRDKDVGLIVYCDSDFAGDDETGKSTTGSVFMYAGGPIHWRSQRQSLITLSSTEAEYVSICATVKDTIWLRKLALELNIIDNVPTTILCDNESAIKIATNEKSIHRTRHMKVQAAYPREQMELGEVAIEHVRTEKQLADMMTKPTSIQKYVKNRNSLVTAALLSVCLLTNLIGVQTLTFQKVKPTIWLPTDYFVQSNIIFYELHVRFLSPCSLIPSSANKDTMLYEYNNNLTIYDGLMKDCTKLYRDLFYEKYKELENIVPPKPISKRSILNSLTTFATGITGAVLGVVISNLLTSAFEIINPNSDHNKLITTQDVVMQHTEMFNRFEKQMNATYETQRGLLDAMKLINKSIRDQDRKLRHLEETLPHFTWIAAYIQSKIISGSIDLRNVLDEYRQGRVATDALADLLNITQLRGIPSIDTRFESINVVSNTAWELKFIVKERDKNTHIYKVDAFRVWGNLTETPKLMSYNGAGFVLYNASNNCVKGIDEPYMRGIIEDCMIENYEDKQLTSWHSIVAEDGIMDTHTTVKRTLQFSYVYCYPKNITIDSIKYRCPPNVFRLPLEVGFETEDHRVYKPIKVYHNYTDLDAMAIDSINLNHYDNYQDTEDELALINKIRDLDSRLQSMTEQQKEAIVVVKYSTTWWVSSVLMVIMSIPTALYLWPIIMRFCLENTIRRIIYPRQRVETQERPAFEMVHLTSNDGNDGHRTVHNDPHNVKHKPLPKEPVYSVYPQIE